MWKERFKNRILRIILFQFCVISSLYNQAGVNALMTKHTFQTLTSRTSYYKILLDHFGQMYIATSEGIIIFNGTTEYFVKGSESIGNQRVSCMIEDKNGVIWIGCANGSIYKIINKILFHWQPKFNLPRKKISRMAIDGQNQLWFSTKGDGIYCYTGKYVYRFTEENGLIHNDINDMVYVRETGVVVSSDLGIQVLKCTNQIEIENATRFSCLLNNEIVQDLIEGNGYIGMNNLVTGIEIWNYYSDCCYNIWNNSLSELIITLSITKNYQAIVTTDHFYLSG